MKKFNVAILGASGAVGKEMIKILEERNIPIKELRLLSSPRSAGNIMRAFNQDYVLQATDEHSFDDIDIVLSAITNEAALHWIPIAVKKGAFVVDNSSAYRMNPDVPLIIPEVNSEDMRWSNGIIANPNCATIIGLVALAPLHRYAKIKRLIVSTYQAVSGAGVEGIHELETQIKSIEEGNTLQVKQFQHQIAYNLIPQIGDFDENGYSSEEMKMQNEGRKILHHDSLLVNCTCVRVPIIRSHSESITVEFEDAISVKQARTLLEMADGVELMDDPLNHCYPMPLNTSNQDLISVGRIRQDISTSNNSLSFWCCGDQLRKGAATNAVQIAELYIKQLK